MEISFVGLDDLIQHLNAAGQVLTAAGIRLHADAPYAAFVEQGTARMAARPYLEPAVEQMGEQVAGLVAAGLVETIETGNPAALRRAIASGARLVEERAQQLVHVVTGTLRASIHAEVI